MSLDNFYSGYLFIYFLVVLVFFFAVCESWIQHQTEVPFVDFSVALLPFFLRKYILVYSTVYIYIFM